MNPIEQVVTEEGKPQDGAEAGQCRSCYVSARSEQSACAIGSFPIISTKSRANAERWLL